MARKAKASAKKSVAKKRARKGVEASVRVCANPVAELREKLKKDLGVQLLDLADDNRSSRILQYLPTGSIALDRLFGWRGIPTGRVVELYGPNHIGKSTIIDSMFASVQKLGGLGVLIDTEFSRQAEYSRTLGVKTEELLIPEFTSTAVEDVIDTIQLTVKHLREVSRQTPVVIGWDSLAGTPTREERGKKSGESTVASAAKLLRAACRQLMGDLGGSRIVLVVANHQYQNINTSGYGPRRSTYGGEGLRHAASLRVELRPNGYFKDKQGVILGQQVVAKLDKDRVSSNAWMETDLVFVKGRGIDNVWSLNDLLVKTGLAVVSGSWTVANVDGGEVKWQGYNGLMSKIQADGDLFNRLLSGLMLSEKNSANVHV